MRQEIWVTPNDKEPPHNKEILVTYLYRGEKKVGISRYNSNLQVFGGHTDVIAWKDKPKAFDPVTGNIKKKDEFRKRFISDWANQIAYLFNDERANYSLELLISRVMDSALKHKDKLDTGDGAYEEYEIEV